jgi:branched-chain amino acid transport system substrate-binding protein
LAQDLITREKVDLFAGFLLTPNALAVADISAQEKRFMVNMNAAAATITTKSPYIVRTTLTVPQLNETLGIWTRRNGVRTVYTIVADFGPGHVAENDFQFG